MTRFSGTISSDTICTSAWNQTPENVPEALLPWVLQHACFTINRYLVHTDGVGNYQRCWGVQYDSATCNFGEVVLADIKPITVNKLDITNNEQKTEGMWLGKTTNSGEHIIATNDNAGKVFYTRSLTSLTPELQWDKKVFDKINIPQLDTSMNEDYVEEEHIGKTTIDEVFTKTGLNEKQSGHRLWNNSKEPRHQPPESGTRS
eukprot:6491711-Amphidinium_carterae.2